MLSTHPTSELHTQPLVIMFFNSENYYFFIFSNSLLRPITLHMLSGFSIAFKHVIIILCHTLLMEAINCLSLILTCLSSGC